MKQLKTMKKASFLSAEYKYMIKTNDSILPIRK